MQVILLEKVVNLGGLGDVVKVKDGFARNFLIPQGKAKRATPANLAEFETRRAELEKAQADALAAPFPRFRVEPAPTVSVRVLVPVMLKAVVPLPVFSTPPPVTLRLPRRFPVVRFCWRVTPAGFVTTR